MVFNKYLLNCNVPFDEYLSGTLSILKTLLIAESLGFENVAGEL